MSTFYYLINTNFISEKEFRKIEDVALKNATKKKHMLIKMYRSNILNQKIFLNLN